MSYYSQIHTPTPSLSAQQFESIYNAQQSEGNQSFVEWFSGDVLDSIWVETDHAGIWTRGLSDVVDGGYGMSITSPTTNDRARIDFGFSSSITHYDETSSGFCTVISGDTTTSINSSWGLCDGGSNSFLATEFYVWQLNSSASNFRILSDDDVSSSAIESGIALDTNAHYFKAIINNSAIHGHIDGQFEVTKTTNLPSVDLSPTVYIQAFSTTDVGSKVRYYEAWNI